MDVAHGCVSLCATVEESPFFSTASLKHGDTISILVQLQVYSYSSLHVGEVAALGAPLFVFRCGLGTVVLASYCFGGDHAAPLKSTPQLSPMAKYDPLAGAGNRQIGEQAGETRVATERAPLSFYSGPGPEWKVPYRIISDLARSRLHGTSGASDFICAEEIAEPVSSAEC
jgi:hypothetical protein